MNNPKHIKGVCTYPTISSWEKLEEVYEKFPFNDWIFRGQESANWPLKSTFERAKSDVDILV